MDLRHVNQFTPLPAPCSTLPRPETGLVDDLVWLFEQFTCSKLLLGLVAKFCFGEYSGEVKRFHTGYVCCWQSMHVLFREREISFFFFVVSPKYMDSFCKKDFSWLYYFQHCCLVNQVVCWNCVIFTYTYWQLPRKGCNTAAIYFKMTVDEGHIQFILFIIKYCMIGKHM
jgi:hypothetical protein